MAASSKRYRVRKSHKLRGEVHVPGDKSIGHRALIFASLARGTSTIRGLSRGEDNAATAKAFRAMGVQIDDSGDELSVHGVGLRGLRMPADVIDCGNSGTTMRLLSGLLSAQRFGTRLVGDASLTRRPMGRIIKPLRARGALIAGTAGGHAAHSRESDNNAAHSRESDTEDELYPPISIAPLVEGEQLSGIEYSMPVASAQVKSCLLLSGLYAAGPTMIEEPVLSRDHTERMMLALGVPLRTVGPAVVLDPTLEWSGGWEPFQWTVPGDPSSAAFPLLAAAMLPDSKVSVGHVCTNPTRTGLFDLLRLYGIPIDHQPAPAGAGDEPVATLTVEHGTFRGGLIGGELLVRMIDEVPAVCALAAVTENRTEIRDAAELRVKESDRIAAMASVLTAFGVSCHELEDGLIIEGTKTLTPARVESRGDHRIAMAATLLGLAADGESIIDDVACVDTSFPGFVELLRALGANIKVEEG